MTEENKPLTRDSNLTVVERIKREPKFGKALLHEVLGRLLNRRELGVARDMLRQLVEGVLGEEGKDFHDVLDINHFATLEELNPIYDAVWKKLVRDDPSSHWFERHSNPRVFYEKHRNDPDEPGGIMAISPELYKEMFGDGDK